MVVKPGIEEQILQLEEWLKTQPQLPQNIDGCHANIGVFSVEQSERLQEDIRVIEECC